MSKERLTERFSNGQAAVKGCGTNCNYGYEYCVNNVENCPTITEIYEKLAEYEDLEEQGLLLRLPCHCRDCKHVDYVGCAGTTCYCKKNGAFMQEDDFCKYAEKDEAEEKLRELEGTV